MGSIAENETMQLVAVVEIAVHLARCIPALITPLGCKVIVIDQRIGLELFLYVLCQKLLQDHVQKKKCS